MRCKSSKKLLLKNVNSQPVWEYPVRLVTEIAAATDFCILGRLYRRISEVNGVCRSLWTPAFSVSNLDVVLAAGQKVRQCHILTIVL